MHSRANCAFSRYSAPVLFNLANAQQRDGNLGQAILNYERALLLTPNNPDISANLRIAHEKARVEVERRSRIKAAADSLTMNAWFGLAAIAVFLLTATLPLKYIWPGARRPLN